VAEFDILIHIHNILIRKNKILDVFDAESETAVKGGNENA
jgi:hypothetical protein